MRFRVGFLFGLIPVPVIEDYMPEKYLKEDFRGLCSRLSVPLLFSPPVAYISPKCPHDERKMTLRHELRHAEQAILGLDNLFPGWACEIDAAAEGVKEESYPKIVSEAVWLGDFFGKMFNINPFKFTKIVYDEVKRRGGNV